MSIFNRKGKEKPKNSKKFEEYKTAATDWERDRVREAARSRSVAWIAFGFMLVIASLEALAIYALAPMKEKVPYLLRVDNSTGIVDEMITVYDEKTLSDNKAMIRYFIKKYIDAREGYQYKFAQNDYETVYFMSEANEAISYRDNYNSDSPVQRLGNKTAINVKIKTFELIDNSAIVRVLTEKQTAGEKTEVRHLLIRLSYDFVKGKIPQSVRDITPLGFIVTNYNVTEEFYQ